MRETKPGVWYKFEAIRRAAPDLGTSITISTTVHHVTLVVSHGLGEELAKIVLGIERGASVTDQYVAIGIMVGWLAFVVVAYVWATRSSHRSPRRIQHGIEHVVDPVKYAFLHSLISRQHYSPERRSASPRINGRPPHDTAYEAMARDHFANWALEVRGLVERPLRLRLEDLLSMERQSQITKHNCIQGWSYVAEWTGVPLRAILEQCNSA